MAPTTDTTFATDTRKRRHHNHIFGHPHRTRRGEAIDTTAIAKDYPLFVPPKSTLPTASGTFGQPTGIPTQSLPMSAKENFLIHTMAAVAVAFAILAALTGLIIMGVILKQKISKRRKRHPRQIGEGTSRADLVEEKQEDVFDKKSPNSPASSFQNSPASMESPALRLEHAARSPAQRTVRPSWFARIFQKARTGFHRKDTESPKEASPFLGGKSVESPQQKTWLDFSSPEYLSYPMPLLPRMPEECKDDESQTGSRIALTSALSLHHSKDSVAFTSSVHRASHSLRFSKAVEAGTIVEAYKGDQRDVQEVSIPTSVSTERIVSSSTEERSCPAMVYTGSELVPTASLQTVSTTASAERENEIFELRENLTRSVQMDKAILVSLAGEGEENRNDEPSNTETEQAPSYSTITRSSTTELLPQPERSVSARVGLETSLDPK